MMPLLSWLFLVTAVSLYPFKQLPSAPGGDKLVHFLMYAVTAALFFGTLIKRKMRFFTVSALSVLIPALWGALIEVVQGHTGRTPDVKDALTNFAGALTAMLLIGYKRKWR